MTSRMTAVSDEERGEQAVDDGLGGRCAGTTVRSRTSADGLLDGVGGLGGPVVAAIGPAA